MTFAILVFVVALAVIASDRIDRTKVALLGAALVVVSQTVDQDEATHASTSTRSGCWPA